jgi:hypothetical protein
MVHGAVLKLDARGAVVGVMDVFAEILKAVFRATPPLYKA